MEQTINANDLVMYTTCEADEPRLSQTPPGIGLGGLHKSTIETSNLGVGHGTYPARVVRVNDDGTADLAVVLYGGGIHIVTSAPQGQGPGQWYPQIM